MQRILVLGLAQLLPFELAGPSQVTAEMVVLPLLAFSEWA